MSDPFELLEEVGRGGMGTVWRARDTRSGEIVAIKLLHREHTLDPGYLVRFDREVETSVRIVSPNVVRVLGQGRRDGVPYIVMEFVEGESLRDRLLRAGPMTWSEAVPVIRAVLTGLSAAHQANVLHRDIKPANILLGSSGSVKIADFGIAKATDLEGLTGGVTMLGTPAYMAPDSQESVRSDLYSLGCVIFEMLTGSPPFRADTLNGTVAAHFREAPRLEALPGAGRLLTGALLEKDPGHRPQSATETMGILRNKTLPALRIATRARPESEAHAHPDPRSLAPGTDADSQGHVNAERRGLLPASLLPSIVGFLLLAGAVGGAAIAWLRADVRPSTRSAGADPQPTMTVQAPATAEPPIPTRAPVIGEVIVGSDFSLTAMNCEDAHSYLQEGNLTMEMPAGKRTLEVCYVDPGRADIEIVARVFSPGQWPIVLACRNTPASSQYRAEFDATRMTVSILRVIYREGLEPEISSLKSSRTSGLSTSGFVDISLSCVGPNLEAAVNGVPEVAVVDSTIANGTVFFGTSPGHETYSVLWDEVQVIAR